MWCVKLENLLSLRKCNYLPQPLAVNASRLNDPLLDFIPALARDVRLHDVSLLVVRQLVARYERVERVTEDGDAGRDLADHALTVAGKVDAEHACKSR